MSDDWEASDSDTAAPKAKIVAAVVPLKKVGRGKWEGEDDDDDGPVSDWEASSDEEDSKPVSSAPVTAPKKKGTLKAKLAEKEAEKAARIAAGEDLYDEDDVLDPREKIRRDRERELNADLSTAAELFGTAAISGSSSELDALLSFQPRTKDDFHKLSTQIIELVIKRHQNAPLYASFLEHHARELAMPLKDVEVRKVASGLTTLANEKQKEQRDKASGKKKPKTGSKPALGAAKTTSKLDTSAYEESLDDFGSNADDFM